MEHALPRRTAGIPRTWSLCMTSENHGTVGPAGCKFSHAPEKHERVLVVEVPAEPGAGRTAHPNWLDYDPAKDILTIYGVKYSGELFSGLGLGPVGMSFTILAREDGALTLCRGPVAAQAGQVVVQEGWINIDETEPPEHELIALRYWPYGNSENPQAVTGGRYIDGTYYNDEGDEMHPPSHWCRLPYFDAEATAKTSTSGERQEGGAV
jgi:hypothetical protein